jgi:leader peptidase (prepilin peptidase)/N-methyltransferase
LLLNVGWLVLTGLGLYRFGLGTEAVAFSLVALATLVVGVTDFTCHLIPDRLVVTLLGAGMLLATIPSCDQSVIDAAIGAAAGFLMMYAIGWSGSRVFKRPAMGGGDIKLTAALGAFLGWQGIVTAIFLASILGLLFVAAKWVLKNNERNELVPLGPFLGVAGLTVLLLGGDLHPSLIQLALERYSFPCSE